MKTLNKNFFFYILFLCLGFVLVGSSIVRAQMPAELANKPKGVLQGQLFSQDQTGKKSFLENHKVAMMVFFKGQRVLMLDKTTDSQGKFEFKNIFQDSDYQYALGAVIDGKLYVYPKISLPLGQDVYKADFEVGESSSYFVDESKIAAQVAAMQKSSNSSGMSSEIQIQPIVNLASNQAKYMSLGLGLAVLLLALYFAFLKRNP